MYGTLGAGYLTLFLKSYRTRLGIFKVPAARVTTCVKALCRYNGPPLETERSRCNINPAVAPASTSTVQVVSGVIDLFFTSLVSGFIANNTILKYSDFQLFDGPVAQCWVNRNWLWVQALLMMLKPSASFQAKRCGVR